MVDRRIARIITSLGASFGFPVSDCASAGDGGEAEPGARLEYCRAATGRRRPSAAPELGRGGGPACAEKGRQTRLHVLPIMAAQRLVADRAWSVRAAAALAPRAVPACRKSGFRFRAGTAFRPAARAASMICADRRRRRPIAPDRPGPVPPAAARSAGCGPARSAAAPFRSREMPPFAPPCRRRSRGSARPPSATAVRIDRRQRGAERRDGLGIAGLRHRDDVDIALDDDDRVAVMGRFPRAMMVEQHRAFVEQLGLRRIQVFWLDASRPCARPPKAMTRPQRSWIGNITRSRKRS